MLFPDVAHRFDKAPLLVYWEATQACELACVHCRAEAMRTPPPGELSTPEALGLVEQAADLGARVLVATGGDPMQRSDLFVVLARAREAGLGVAVTPSAGPGLDGAACARLARAEPEAVALSLDGSSANLHDTFRGAPGAFERTRSAAAALVDLGVPVQVNTTVTAGTAPDLPAIAQQAAGLGAFRWSLFFLIRVGRGRALASVSPGEGDHLCRWLLDLAREAPFEVKATEAHHIRRILIDGLRRAGASEAEIVRHPAARGFAVRDGSGVVFVSSRGDVYPSGFLPLKAGSVREASLAAVYRTAPMMVALRDPDRLKGKCGRCAYRAVCGGSRARAFADSGDPLAEDPLCPSGPPEVA